MLPYACVSVCYKNEVLFQAQRHVMIDEIIGRAGVPAPAFFSDSNKSADTKTMMSSPWQHRRAASIFSVQVSHDDKEVSPSLATVPPDAEKPSPTPKHRTSLSLSFDDDDDGALKDDDDIMPRPVDVHQSIAMTGEVRIDQRVESASPSVGFESSAPMSPAAFTTCDSPLAVVSPPSKINISDLAAAMSWGARNSSSIGSSDLILFSSYF